MIFNKIKIVLIGLSNIFNYNSAPKTREGIAIKLVPDGFNDPELVSVCGNNAKFYMCFDEKEPIDVDLVYTEAVDSSFNERDGAILEFEVKRKKITEENQTIVFIKAIPFTEKTDNIYKK